MKDYSSELTKEQKLVKIFTDPLNEKIEKLYIENKELKKQLRLNGVGRGKRKSNFELFNEINSDFLQAMIDNDQGVYDPVEEFKQNLEDKYIIIKK